MKKIHLGLIGIATLFLTACTVGVSSNKNSVIKNADSITNLTVTFDFNGGAYNGSTEQVEFNDVKPTSYWKYVKARLTGTITPPAHNTFEGFSFAKDNPEIIDDSYVIKEDITVYAQYKAIPEESCTVNWRDGVTSEIIKTETYFENQTPDFKDIPYHEGKVFKCWEPEITPITHEDVGIGKSRTYTAIYDPIETYHIVKLDYDDGTPVHIQKVFHEECAVKPEIAKEGYKLDKWEYTGEKSGTFNFDTKITEDIEIKAVWIQCYTITWKNYDGTIIKEDKIEEGESPIKPSNPRRYSTDPFIDYTFKEWSPSVIEEVHSNQTYIATYQTVLYNDTKTCMHITTVDGNKDFAFTFAATSSITIDWGDGTPQKTESAGTVAHTYENTGEFNIRIFNPITSISVSGITPPPDSALIEELYLGEDVTSIGDAAFDGCSQLQTVTFASESKLQSIGTYAFYGCSSLIGIAIPSSVTSIGHNVFKGCSSLTSITIPSGVTLINTSAFYGCSQLQTVTFADESKLTSIGNYAFYGCSALTEITIPSGVTSIGESAFYGCSQLQTVTFASESKLQSIGESAFQGCSALTGITIPSGVTSIGEFAFYSCSSLTSIAIPSSVTSIEGYAFEFCSQLQTVTFAGESKLTSIGKAAFYGCSQLQTVDLTVLNSVPDLGGYAFDNCSKSLELHVKTNMLEAFKAADGWKEYKDKITDDPVPSTNI